MKEQPSLLAAALHDQTTAVGYLHHTLKEYLIGQIPTRPEPLNIDTSEIKKGIEEYVTLTTKEESAVHNALLDLFGDKLPTAKTYFTSHGKCSQGASILRTDISSIDFNMIADVASPDHILSHKYKPICGVCKHGSITPQTHRTLRSSFRVLPDELLKLFEEVESTRQSIRTRSFLADGGRKELQTAHHQKQTALHHFFTREKGVLLAGWRVWGSEHPVIGSVFAAAHSNAEEKIAAPDYLLTAVVSPNKLNTELTRCYNYFGRPNNEVPRFSGHHGAHTFVGFVQGSIPVRVCIIPAEHYLERKNRPVMYEERKDNLISQYRKTMAFDAAVSGILEHLDKKYQSLLSAWKYNGASRQKNQSSIHHTMHAQIASLGHS